jgi:hypothetical protein
VLDNWFPLTWRNLIVVFILLFILSLYIAGFRSWLAPIGRAFVVSGLFWAVVAAAIALFAIVHVAVSIITGTKLRRVKIFISFKHDYESIATELEKALADRDIEAVRLPFRRREHDNVIRESFKAVDTADGVVVVPGPQPSWLNNELSIAVARQKPIAVIKHLPAQPLSDSLYRGYPVFAWDKLHPNGFAPLRRFLNFATKSRGDVLPQFQRVLSGMGVFIVEALFQAF